MLYISISGCTSGRKAALMAATGISLGCVFHIGLAFVGLSSILAALPGAMNILRAIGIVYVGFIGLNLLFAKGVTAALDPLPDGGLSLWKIGVNGFLTNVTNVKVILFFLLYLPQFASHEVSGQKMSILLLGLIFLTGATLVNFSVAMLAPRAPVRNAIVIKWVRRCVGGFFVLVSVQLLLNFLNGSRSPLF